MAIILRLEGLDVKANTGDIRSFFKCFHIPDGGVYIVGGRLREAFIAFTSERDGQLAMRQTGQPLKGSQVTLHISSMEELEHKLKAFLKRSKPSPSQPAVKRPRPSSNVNVEPVNAEPRSPPAAKPPPTTTSKLDPRTANLPQPRQPDTSNLQSSNAMDSSTAFLLGICTVLQGLQSSHCGENNEPVLRVTFPKTHSTVVSNGVRTPEEPLNSKPGYVRLFGLPASATKEVICHFFKGLTVQEAIVNVKLGISHGCLVKFASEQEACEALLFNQRSLDQICVEVRGATEKMWTSAIQECENAFNHGERVKLKQSPLRETANHKQNPAAQQVKRQTVNRSLSKPPKRPDVASTTALSPTMEYTLKVSNLPKTLMKTDIKELLGCPNIAHKNVIHLLDKEGNKTDTTFVILNRTEDYEYALNLSGCHVGSDSIEISSVTKTMMRDIMARTKPRSLEQDTKKRPNQKRKFDLVETPEEAQIMDTDPTAQTCLFVRNMPADVQKSQITTLFHKFGVKKGNVVLLHDSNGKGIGEAVVQFKSQKLAALAQRLHGREFLGTKVLLTHINMKQMDDILTRNF
ncbi:RNA binding motif protein 12Ba [Acanthopagrus latus]|uniref:RNA binding motif protein 12Ba n=1 Tax=Acanthopagrus latus TaxID=8177 RepID=UPI00187C0E82|nr:RNA binding motif protein 12Ba [Acanthopagrus latus]